MDITVYFSNGTIKVFTCTDYSTKDDRLNLKIGDTWDSVIIPFDNVLYFEKKIRRG
jgi:hypothetical protein